MILVPSLLVMLAATVEAKRAGAAPIIVVNPDVWVQECATVFREMGWGWRSDAYPYYVNYSSYDLLKKPSGLCMVRTSSLESGGRGDIDIAYVHVLLRTNAMFSLICLSSFFVVYCFVFVYNTDI